MSRVGLQTAWTILGVLAFACAVAQYAAGNFLAAAGSAIIVVNCCLGFMTARLMP